MPHWDFKCANCGHTYDLAFTSFDDMQRFDTAQACMNCDSGPLERQASAPGAFAVHGFSEVNGYASPIDITMRRGGMKVKIQGNPEILRNGTH